MRALSSGVERSVRNGKAAGANPAESTSTLCLLLAYKLVYTNLIFKYQKV